MPSSLRNAKPAAAADCSVPLNRSFAFYAISKGCGTHISKTGREANAPVRAVAAKGRSASGMEMEN